jgi:Sigma-70, region 4
MPTVDSLPPAQKAVLALLVGQRMSYDDIARLLKLSDAAVRERAHVALTAVGPQDTGLTARRRAELGDWLLRQDADDEREETDGLLARSAAARAWARAVAQELEPLGGDGPPEVPGDGDDGLAGAAPAPASPGAAPVFAADPTSPPAAAPTPAVAAAATPRVSTGPPAGADVVSGPIRAPRRASRAGGAALLAGVALVAIVLIVVLTRGGDNSDKTSGRTTRTATQAATPKVLAQVNLRPPKDGPARRALGVVQIVRINGRQAINAVFDGLPRPTGKNVGYGIWLWSSPQKRKWLGFLSAADQQGRLVAQGRFDEDITLYRELLLTRENRRNPPAPGTVYLRGPVREGR